jgi:hypothetical protein
MKDLEKLSDEELRELQRKEAIENSEEYDIQDRTYNNAPIARQYILDEKIAKGSTFADDEDRPAHPKNPILVVDEDENEDDIILIPVCDSDEENIEEVPEIDSNFQSEKAQTEDGLTQTTTEAERDYIDRSIALSTNDAENYVIKKAEKSQNTDKVNQHKNVSALSKWILLIVSLLIVAILCVVIYFCITNYVSESQKMSEAKMAYIELTNDTNVVVLNENEICKDFILLTDNLLLDIIDIDKYKESLENLSKRLQSEINTAGSFQISNSEDSQIKAAVIDYLRSTKSMIDRYNDDAVSADDLKLKILMDLNTSLDNRDIRYNNLLALIYEQAENYDINAYQKDNVIMFDLAFEEQ